MSRSRCLTISGITAAASWGTLHLTSWLCTRPNTCFDQQAEQSYTFEATSLRASEDAASTAESAALPGPNLSATFAVNDPPRSARPADDANFSNCTRAGQVLLAARLTGLQDPSLGARCCRDSTRLRCLCKLARSNAPTSCTASTAAGSCSGTTTWKNLSPPVLAASSQSVAAIVDPDATKQVLPCLTCPSWLTTQLPCPSWHSTKDTLPLTTPKQLPPNTC